MWEWLLYRLGFGAREDFYTAAGVVEMILVVAVGTVSIRVAIGCRSMFSFSFRFLQGDLNQKCR